MVIRMYDCGFGDCFRIENNNANLLYVDFGTAAFYEKTDNLYDRIIDEMPNDNMDFLLTHYHKDHFAGVCYMSGNASKKFQNVYIPDIWKINDAVDVVSLYLLSGLLSKTILERNLTLIDFLISICKVDSKIHFISKDKSIQNDYVALWPDSEISYSKLFPKKYSFGENQDWEKLHSLAEKLVSSITEKAGDDGILKADSEIGEELQEINNAYKGLKESFSQDKKLLYDLREWGNTISIVFQSKNTIQESQNILFTGDVGIGRYGNKDIWKKIRENRENSALANKNNFKLIKIPHHGTKNYYFDFSEFVDNGVWLLIPNGDHKKWKIYEGYKELLNTTKGNAVCSDCSNCNAFISAGKCVCSKEYVIRQKSPNNYYEEIELK